MRANPLLTRDGIPLLQRHLVTLLSVLIHGSVFQIPRLQTVALLSVLVGDTSNASVPDWRNSHYPPLNEEFYGVFRAVHH